MTKETDFRLFTTLSNLGLITYLLKVQKPKYEDLNEPNKLKKPNEPKKPKKHPAH